MSPSVNRPFATVHIPVLKGKETAIYVAHRSALEWFVGGAGFTDDHDGQFQRAELALVRELLGPHETVLDLPVGDHAFRDGEGRPWQRGRIPSGRTFLVTYEVRATGPSSGPPGIGGAVANCWIVCPSMAAAKRTATEHLETDGWTIIDAIGGIEKFADDLAEGTESYFRQAQIDGFVCVVLELPRFGGRVTAYAAASDWCFLS
jgi:hypothetical protein